MYVLTSKNSNDKEYLIIQIRSFCMMSFPKYEIVYTDFLQDATKFANIDTIYGLDECLDLLNDFEILEL